MHVIEICFLVGKNKRVSDAHFRAFVAFAGSSPAQSAAAENKAKDNANAAVEIPVFICILFQPFLLG